MDTLVIGVANPKGGVGKTTLCVHLARAVQIDGLTPVVVDTDLQGSAKDWHSAGPNGYHGPDVVHVKDPSNLRSHMVRLSEDYDVALLDGAAQLQRSTGTVIGVSDLLLVPVRPSALSLWGTKEFLGHVVEAAEDGKLHAAFVASQRDPRTTLSNELEDAIGGYGLPVLEGTCKRVSYARSMAEGQTVFESGDEKAEAEISTLLNDVAQLIS